MTTIVACVGLAVSHIQAMSINIAQITVSLQILTEKITSADKILQDHEQRLRSLERNPVKSNQ